MQARLLAMMLTASIAIVAPCSHAAEAVAPGENLARKSGCLVCHSVDNRIVGKAYRVVAAKYRNIPFATTIIRWKVRNGAGKGKAIPMPAFDETTLSDEDLQTIAQWILDLR